MVNNVKPVVLQHTRAVVIFHPAYVDFAGYRSFRPWAHWPYHLQTKGKMESGGEVRPAQRARREALRLVGPSEPVAARVKRDGG